MSYIPRAEKKAVLAVLYSRDGGFCCWCDRTLIDYPDIPYITSGKLPKDYPTIEHLIKRAHRGPNRLWNYKLSCPPCNTKRDKRMKELSRPDLLKEEGDASLST